MFFKKGFAWVIVTIVVVLFSVSSSVYAETKYAFKIGTLAPDGVGWAALVKKYVVPKLEQVAKGGISIDI